MNFAIKSHVDNYWTLYKLKKYNLIMKNKTIMGQTKYFDDTYNFAFWEYLYSITVTEATN